jgi:hypothetical protein
VVIAVIGVLTVLLVVGLIGFFADPLQLPEPVLDVLDKRSSVISMFIAVVGLPISVTALLLQLRQNRSPLEERSETAAIPAPALTSSIEAAQETTKKPTLQLPAPAPSVAQSSLSSPGSFTRGRRSYGGDHIEFHHNTAYGPVTGKTVTPPPAQGSTAPDE